MNTRIECVKECVLLRIHISSDFSNKNAFHTVHKFNRKCNELRYHFILLLFFWMRAPIEDGWLFNY